MSHCLRFAFSCALVLMLLVAVPGHAQVLYGSVVGTISDSSGAAIPGATVTLKSRDTNLVLSAVSNEAGQYTFTNVLPDTYDVRVSLQGFREFIKTGVPVGAGNVSRVDARLELGALTESITVTSETTLLQTDKTDTRSEFQAKEVEDLPLPEFRNYQSLLDLVPGTTPGVFQNAEIDTPARALQTTVNGTNPNNNSTRVDGATNQFTWLPHHTLYVSPAETIATVNVSTSSFGADQGMAGGAAVTVVTKSGTNRYRGSAFGFYSDQNLRARTYFTRRNNTRKQPSNHHIDGFTLGGPILRNRIFFFGAWEGQYRVSEGERTYSVPVEAIRNGDFSNARSGATLVLIYDPLTGNPNGTGRQPFPGNIIPPERISPIARRIQEFYPLPNRAGATSNYFQSFRETSYRDQYDVKINWNRSGSHQIWGKVGVMDAEVSNLVKLGFEGGGLGDTRTYVGTVGQTWTISRSFVVDSTLGYSLLDQFVHGPDYGTPYGLELGIPGTNGPDIRQSGFPRITNGYSQIGSTESWSPLDRYDPTWTFSTNVTRLAGKHQLRLGVQIDHQEMNHWQPEVGTGPRGAFTFGGGVTALRGGRASNFYNQYAQFLLGLPTNISKSLQHELMTTREWKHGLYLNDVWQMSRRLTLTLGLRWEYYPLVTREDRGIELLDLDTMEVLLGGVGGNPRDLGLEPSKRLFAPRLGVAYRLNENTVFRGGYGLTYNPLPFARPLRGFYPLTIANTWVGASSFAAAGRLDNGIPLFTGPTSSQGRVPLPATVTMRTPDPDNIDRGHIQSWNVTIERRLPFAMSVSAAYVGTKTTDGFADIELNTSPPGGGTAGRRFVRPFGRTASTLLWGAFTKANYHSLQVSLQRPFRKGLFLRGAYTLGKAMNMTDQDGWVGLNWNSPDQIHRNFARAGFDRPHNLQLAFIYALPCTKECGAPGVLKPILRDWQTNGTFSALSGTPFTVTASATSLDNFGDLQTADQVAVIAKQKAGPFKEYYHPSAWDPVSGARFGTSGRNSVRGPGYWNLNLSVFRTFPLGDRLKLQFRAEGYSVANTPRWSNPVANASSGSFMQITGTPSLASGNSGARTVRLGLRLTF